MASLMKTLDPNQRRDLNNIRAAAKRIWERPLHRDYTDHTVAHSERIIILLNGLTGEMMKAAGKRLSPNEIFVLLAATYLHDIGMQDERFANGDLEVIRANHHEISAELIFRATEDTAQAIKLGLPDDPGLVEAIALISKGHRKVDLVAQEYESLVQGSESIRLQLLAALLRFGDELDIDFRRVDLEQMKLMNLEVESQLHWWKCHYVGGVNIADENVQIAYRFPQGRSDYQDFIVPLVEGEIRAKHAALESIFRANGIKVAVVKSQVRLMRAVKPLPPDVEALARQKSGLSPKQEPLDKPLPPEVFLGTREPGSHFRVPEVLLVPAGPFWMGSSDNDPCVRDSEKPRRECNLPEYQIGRYPVTNAEYKSFLDANPQHNVPFSNKKDDDPYNWDGKSRSFPPGQDDHPVVLVSWYDATDYCRWLSQVTGKQYRLPTEEEWEKAARGSLPETRVYPWGDEWRSGTCNTEELGRNKTSSVHEFEQANQSPLGVVDMMGNVWEWTSSWYVGYPGSSHTSNRYGQSYRVVRGGSWYNPAEDVRICCRGSYKPEEHRPYVGFRVVLDLNMRVSGDPLEQAPEFVDRMELYQNLTDCFNMDELKTLCFRLRIQYDDLPAEGREGKARELVEYCMRRGSLSELIEICQQLRPKVRW